VIEELGPEGLEKKKTQLAAAIGQHADPPAHVLESFPLADTDSIRFLPLISHNYTSPNEPAGFPLKSIPYRFQFDSIDSQYVRFSVVLNTTGVFEMEERNTVELLAYVWQKSPIVSNGKELSLAEVIKKKDKVTLEFSTRLVGTNFIEFRCKCALEKYDEAIKFAKDVLFNVKLDADKVRNHVEKVIKRYTDWKNSETGLLDTMMLKMFYVDDYPGQESSYLKKHAFAKKIKAQLETDPESVIRQLDAVRRRLLKPKHTVVYLAARFPQFHIPQAIPISF